MRAVLAAGEVEPAHLSLFVRSQHNNDKVKAIRALLAMKASELVNDNPELIM